ncbi:MAG: cyclase [Saprospiraceae bacterium]|jgi:cyclase
MAHQNVYQRMSTAQNRAGNITPASPKEALPEITFDQKMHFYALEEPVLFIHIHNAHTDGDALAWFAESNVMHMGDVFFNGRYPYIDLNSGGSLNGMIEAVEVTNLLVDDTTQIIPSHGPMANKEDLLGYYSFLKTLKERLMKAINEGTALEDINVAKMVSGYEDLKWNFINAKKIVSIGYESLKNQT